MPQTESAACDKSHDDNSWIYLWDVLPLQKLSWENDRISFDAEFLAKHPPGSSFLHDRYRWNGGYRYQAPPGVDRCRRLYVATAADFTILRRALPDGDPHNPSWMVIEAKLIASGHAADDCSGMKVPTLLSLLDAMPPNEEETLDALRNLFIPLTAIAAIIGGERTTVSRRIRKKGFKLVEWPQNGKMKAAKVSDVVSTYSSDRDASRIEKMLMEWARKQ